MGENRDQILKTINDNSDSIKSHGVQRLSLFGSAARGEEDIGSDLDFLVEFKKKTFDAYMDLKIFLEQLFGRPVDLVIKDTLKPRLRPIILKEAIDVPGL